MTPAASSVTAAAIGARSGGPPVELIDTVLREAGLDYGAVDVIAVNHGPGSFTGIRAGVAAARGLALAARRPVVAVNSLEVLAAALGPQSAGTIVAALDARRGQVYLQIFDHELVALSEPTRWRRRT